LYLLTQPEQTNLLLQLQHQCPAMIGEFFASQLLLRGCSLMQLQRRLCQIIEAF